MKFDIPPARRFDNPLAPFLLMLLALRLSRVTLFLMFIVNILMMAGLVSVDRSMMTQPTTENGFFVLATLLIVVICVGAIIAGGVCLTGWVSSIELISRGISISAWRTWLCTGGALICSVASWIPYSHSSVMWIPTVWLTCIVGIVLVASAYYYTEYFSGPHNNWKQALGALIKEAR